MATYGVLIVTDPKPPISRLERLTHCAMMSYPMSETSIGTCTARL